MLSLAPSSRGFSGRCSFLHLACDYGNLKTTLPSGDYRVAHLLSSCLLSWQRGGFALSLDLSEISNPIASWYTNQQFVQARNLETMAAS